MQMYAIQSFTICCFNNLIKLSLKRYSRKLKQMPTYAKWESQRLNMPDCLSEFWLKVNYCLQKVLSMSLYPDFILIFFTDFIQVVSRFYSSFIRILSKLYPDFILISSWFFLENSIYPAFIWILVKHLKKYFFQILSRFFRKSLHPNSI